MDEALHIWLEEKRHFPVCLELTNYSRGGSDGGCLFFQNKVNPTWESIKDCILIVYFRLL